MNPIDLNCANLRASLAFYGPAEVRSGVVLITSAVTYSVFNIALLDGPVESSSGELERRILVARQHFESLNRSWSFWICEDWLPYRMQRRLPEIFDRFEMGCIAESPGMQIDELPPPARPLPPLEARRVAGADTRRAFTGIIERCFYVPAPIAQQIYDREGFWDEPLIAWVGYDGPRAVCAAATAAAEGVLGVYSVATLPEYRKRGYAEAIMRSAVADARLRGAAGPIVLQSSSFGLRLYRHLGFKRTTRFFVYATA